MELMNHLKDSMEPNELDNTPILKALLDTFASEMGKQVDKSVVDLGDVMDVLLQFSAMCLVNLLTSSAQFTEEPWTEQQLQEVVEQFMVRAKIASEAAKATVLEHS
jgi:hypothetical protein